MNENTEKVEEIIRESMQDFLEKLKNIVSGSHNSRIDFYFLLNEMKTTDFFNEVSLLLLRSHNSWTKVWWSATVVCCVRTRR